MKLFVVLSVLAAFSSSAIANVTSSKESGKAFCAKMQQDQALVKASSASSSAVSKSSAAR